jgi:hypothetical protein
LVQLGEHVGENPGIGITARDVRAYSTEANAFSSLAPSQEPALCSQAVLLLKIFLPHG